MECHVKGNHCFNEWRSRAKVDNGADGRSDRQAFESDDVAWSQCGPSEADASAIGGTEVLECDFHGTYWWQVEAMQPPGRAARESCLGHAASDRDQQHEWVVSEFRPLVNAMLNSPPAAAPQLVPGQAGQPGFLQGERPGLQLGWNQWPGRHMRKAWALQAAPQRRL
jgi:hypothetical protein